MRHDDADTDNNPARPENDDAQDLQASTFRYGVVKTQAQLMLENPHMNGDMYAEGTIGEEELDENGNGIPDNQEDHIGTFLHQAFDDFICNTAEYVDSYQRDIDNAFIAADRDINDVRSHLHHAVEFVQRNAATDPKAQTLLDNYNTATDNIRAALSNSEQSPTASNFLALKAAELDKSMAKADIVTYEAGAHGETDELDRARKWHDAACGIKDKLEAIQKLPPDQQQPALDKLAQQDPNSRLAREWTKFKAGDLKNWEKQNNQHLTAASPDYTWTYWSRGRGGAASTCSIYDPPGTQIDSPFDLSQLFAWSADPYSPQYQTPAGPAATERPVAAISATPAGLNLKA